MTRIEQFPALRKAFLEMSYDNGGIHRGRTVEEALAETEELLSGEQWDDAKLIRFDVWIASLSDDDVCTLVDGEETEIEDLIADSHLSDEDREDLDELLNELFDVC